MRQWYVFYLVDLIVIRRHRRKRGDSVTVRNVERYISRLRHLPSARQCVLPSIELIKTHI